MAKDPASPSRLSRRLRWLLGLSLALNLLFVGFVLGAAYRIRDGGMAAVPHIGRFAEAYVRAMPAEDQRALRRALRKELRQEAGSTVRRGLYREVLAALRAEQFDVDAVKGVLDQQAQLGRAIQGAAQRAWLDRLTAMSAEERRAYADRLEALLRRGPKGKDRKKQD